MPASATQQVREAASGDVSPQTMRDVYEQIKTPHKYGVVLRNPGTIIDCPAVYRFAGRWYMFYIQWTREIGYETHLADSDDLLHWEPRGKILSFRENEDTWDKWQAGGTVQLIDHRWNGTHEPQKFAGKYWMSYIGGAKKGYETDPLSIGMATSDTPDRAGEWDRLAENPVLRPSDPDARPFEKKTLYRSNIIWDKDETLRHPFVMFYNGKEQVDEKKSVERIGMAVSQDMVQWSRFGDSPVIDNFKGISGDPQVVKIDDLWVMFYFGHAWKPAAFDTFAVSRDLDNWTKWEGEHLTAPSEPWDHKFAHKPWVINHDGVIYHFYGAVGNENRVIGLATSKDLR